MPGTADGDHSDTLPDGDPLRLVASAVGVAARRRLRITWQLEPAVDRPVAGHRVAIGVDGQHLDLPHEGTEPAVELSHRILAQSVPIELALHVVTTYADGGPPTVAEGPFTVPPLHELAPATDWEVGPTEVVVDDATRRALGLEWWVDGCIGFARLDDTVHAFAANGPRTAHWTVGDDRFLGELVDPAVEIEGATGAYAAGGPVLVDPGSGDVLMIYHGEEHPHDDPLHFWSYLGLAVSRDAGRSFRHLGRIVTPEMPLDTHRSGTLVEVGGGPFVVVDGYVHVYFRDADVAGRWRNLCVARVALDDLLAGAAAGRAAPWAKHHDGSWDEPGLGGRASDLLPGATVPRWFDVVHLVDHGRYVMVTSDGMSRWWTTTVRTSVDGVVWSEPAQLLPATDDAELLYLTLTSPELGARREVRGDEVHLLRTRNAGTGGHRWDEAVQERIVLRYRPGAIQR